MIEDNEHAACVDAWMGRATRDPAPERMILEFERAFSALWNRTHQTLGDVTLMAIVDRVLHGAAERFPLLSALKVETTGLQFQNLRDNARTVSPIELSGAIRFVLVEFLVVLGNLTADILTPSLHAELGKNQGEEMGSARKTSSGAPPDRE